MAVHADFIKALHQVIPTLAVAFPHLQHGGCPVFQCFNGRLLGSNGGAEHGILMNFHHGGNKRFRTAGIPQPEPRHGECLGKSVQQERALLHPRQRSYGNMRLAVITQFTVNFIRQHDEVVPDADAGDFLKGFHRGHRSGRIRREVEHQHLGPRCNGRFQHLRVQGEKIPFACRHGGSYAVGHIDAGGIGDITGFVIKNLVPRIQNGTESEIYGFAYAYRHQHFAQGVVVDMEESVHVFDDGTAQGFQPIVGSVGGVPLFQGVNGRFPYVPRRHEVRLPYAQGDDIRASRDQVKKFPDAGTGYGAYLLRYFVLPIHDHSFLNGRELRSDSQAFCLHGSFKHTTVFLVGFQMEVCGSGQHPFQRREFFRHKPGNLPHAFSFHQHQQVKTAACQIAGGDFVEP